MFLRRSVAALAAATALCAVTPTGASALTPAMGSDAAAAAKAGKLPKGLYGEADPKFDGVWRQSIALLALDAAGATPAAAGRGLARRTAVRRRLVHRVPGRHRHRVRREEDARRHQRHRPSPCRRSPPSAGGATRYARLSTGCGPCRTRTAAGATTPAAPATPTPRPSSSAPSRRPARSRRRSARTGSRPTTRSPRSNSAATRRPQDRGAFAYQPDKKGKLAANDDATAAAALAATGSGLLARAHGEDGAGKQRPVKPLECGKGSDGERPGSPEESADAGAARLASVLKKNGDHLKAVHTGRRGRPGLREHRRRRHRARRGRSPGGGEEVPRLAGRRLGAWDKSRNDPAAIGGVMLAVHATGGDAAELEGRRTAEAPQRHGPEARTHAGLVRGRRRRVRGQGQHRADAGPWSARAWQPVRASASCSAAAGSGRGRDGAERGARTRDLRLRLRGAARLAPARRRLKRPRPRASRAATATGPSGSGSGNDKGGADGERGVRHQGPVRAAPRRRRRARLPLRRQRGLGGRRRSRAATRRSTRSAAVRRRRRTANASRSSSTSAPPRTRPAARRRPRRVRPAPRSPRTPAPPRRWPPSPSRCATTPTRSCAPSTAIRSRAAAKQVSGPTRTSREERR